MLRVGGKTILESQIEAFEVAGIKRVCVVVGHLSHLVEAHLKNVPTSLEIELVVNRDFASTNNFVSLISGLSTLNEDQSALVINGDVATEKSHFLPIIAERIESDAVLLTDDRTWQQDAIKASVDANGAVTKLSKETSRLEANLVSCDTYLLRATAIRRLLDKFSLEPETTRNLWVETVLDEMCRDSSFRILTAQVKSLWGEVDNTSDYARMNFEFSKTCFSQLSVKSVVFDLDGTLVQSGRPMESSIDLVHKFLGQGINVSVVSNNTSQTPNEIKGEMVTNGFDPRVQIQTPLDQVVSWLQ
jgi:choline kinase